MEPRSEPPASMRRRRPAGGRSPERTFLFRGGIRIAGTHVTCDAPGSASDLVFLSHAQALGGRVRLGRVGRQELLTTEETLALLGRAAQALRRHVLPASFGRPFVMGDLRLELFPSGHLPGAASLLCEVDGRTVLYAGTVRPGEPALGAAAGEVRRAGAVCVDATFADPRFVFPPPGQAVAELVRLVQEGLAARRAPVVLAVPFGGAMDAAQALSTAGIPVRGHRSMVAAAAAFRAAAGVAPAVARFDGKLPAGAVLLWPVDGREAPLLGTLAAPHFLLAAPAAADPVARSAARVEGAVALTNQAGYPELIAYIEASGAREVALWRGFCQPFAAALRARGLDAYPLGPPLQMQLLAD